MEFFNISTAKENGCTCTETNLDNELFTHLPTGGYITLTFTTLWMNSADDKLIVFLYIPENRL